MDTCGYFGHLSDLDVSEALVLHPKLSLILQRQRQRQESSHWGA